MRLISNSEIASWLTCQRRYYFEYVLNLEQKQFSDALNKGIMIHAVLENYYASKALGLSEEECRQEGLSVVVDALSLDNADIVELGKIHALMGAYFDHWQEDDDNTYRIYAVESKLRAPLSETYSLVGTVDLVWQHIESGKYYMVDHKSSYNFWTEEQAELSGQFVKYLVLGRNADLDVGGIIVNQIRTRELKPGNEIFRRAYVRPTERKIADVLRQHILASEAIMQYRNAPVIEAAIPVFDKFVCSNCSYASICDTYSNGGQIEYGIQQDFKTRTGYGYNNV